MVPGTVVDWVVLYMLGAQEYSKPRLALLEN